ncbi:MAG: peroxiredoxin [Candidatus Verstraetearchaeota archaeon]|nr:peroxiredoxin [Candidatus Verstraetearchaeota archaeon]
MSENRNLPLIGDKAPAFSAQTTKGPVNFPDDYKGKWVVLFSHPADYTPVCTTEFVAFAKRYNQFKSMNVELLGLSIDQIYSHIKWEEWIAENLKVEIPFPIIADNTGKIATLYGMLHQEAKGTQAVRAVFIIDPESVVRAILYYPMSVGRNIDEILRLVKALQISDKENVALPANWPNNELIGNKAIIPPPNNTDEAKKRLNMFNGYDWWFCYREIGE